MSKYKLTILTPVHISSGEEYELNYNLLQKDGYTYIFDEFKLVEYFLSQNISIPTNINELKRLIQSKNDEIIDSGLYIRKIESNFLGFEKPMLENISTDGVPILTGSSIKGSLRTSVLDCLNKNFQECKNIGNLFKHRKNFKDRLINQRGQTPYDNDLAEIFKYLKVTDSIMPLETKIYKTINMKKEKSHQSNRGQKVEEIANYVEAIKPGQSFEIEIKDIHQDNIFKNLAWICNKFYIPFFAQDQKYYFSKKTDITQTIKNASKDVFIINVGRFGGAESKSINNLRYIKASKANDKSTTSARTFALEQNENDKLYYENSLLPFGWIMCEKIEKDDLNNLQIATKLLQKRREERFDAIDNLIKQKVYKEQEEKEKALQKAKEKEEEEKRLKKEQEEKEAKLAAMSPLERKIEELKENNPNPNETIDITIFNAIKNGKLDEFKCDALKRLKEEMQKLKKWVESSKKPEKDKKYKRTQEVMKMIEDCQ